MEGEGGKHCGVVAGDVREREMPVCGTAYGRLWLWQPVPVSVPVLVPVYQCQRKDRVVPVALLWATLSGSPRSATAATTPHWRLFKCLPCVHSRSSSVSTNSLNTHMGLNPVQP